MSTMRSKEINSSSDDDDTIKALEKGQAKKPISALQLDVGKEHMRFRESWWQLWIPAGVPPPPPDSLDDAEALAHNSITPIVSASLLSQLTYTWITPMMVLGYQRTLQATDLWRVGPEQEAGYLSDKLEAAWDQRVNAADEWNAGLDDGRINPPVAWPLPASFIWHGNQCRSLDLVATRRHQRRARPIVLPYCPTSPTFPPVLLPHPVFYSFCSM
ncbi:hypothetical protein FB451DRAFT_1184568 [Mycena latifolia]|nr:hypothetical protein FB451DRAFT_1184568 [Mycena latifolia]